MSKTELEELKVNLAMAEQRLREKENAEIANKHLIRQLEDVQLICTTFLDIEYPMKDGERPCNPMTRLVDAIIKRCES